MEFRCDETRAYLKLGLKMPFLARVRIEWIGLEEGGKVSGNVEGDSTVYT